MANPKNVRTEGLWALQRGGMCEAKSFSWIFGTPFLWFISFGGAKEMNIILKYKRGYPFETPFIKKFPTPTISDFKYIIWYFAISTVL